MTDNYLDSSLHPLNINSSAMPSLGKDLAAIRAYQKLTLDEMHKRTKIPLITIKRIEDGRLYEDKDENQTYVRSFTRSYAKALKLDDDLVVRALDQQNAGNYNNLLLTVYPELQSGTLQPKPTFQLDEPEPVDDISDSAEEITETAEIKPVPEYQKATPPPPTISSVNWVDMGKKITIIDNKTPVWIIGAVVILIIALVTIYFVYENGLFEGVSSEVIVPEQVFEGDETVSNIPLNLTTSPETEQQSEPPVSALDDVLYITLYAAYDKLEPVRVWSDLKPRIDPYWMEKGLAFNFEFRDTIRIRGQYTRMLLFLNGHRITNFRQQYFNNQENAVELTRDIFEADPKWATPIPTELPANVAMPDSIQLRPPF